MTIVDDHGRPEPPAAGDEAATLIGFLEYQRATFAWRCRRLDATGLNRSVAASTMTLGGMLKHMALVETYWFSEQLFGREARPPWSAVDWEADRDWEWHSAAQDTPDELHELWEREVGSSRDRFEEAMADGGLSRLAERGWSDGRKPSLRWILCHMVEEYARHNGHADLIREAIDGETGE